MNFVGKIKIKKYIPDSIMTLLRKKKAGYSIKKLFEKDRIRFQKVFENNLNLMSLEQLEAKLMFSTHSLEKGFSHTDFRPKFGLTALNSIGQTLKVYIDKGYDKNRERYMISLSALKYYICLHEEKGIDVGFLKDIFPAEILEEVKKADGELSGVTIVKSKDKDKNFSLNFEQLAKNRVSVREFSNIPVNKKTVKEAIEMSLKTPSVCNRQPSKVYLISDMKMISKVLKIQGGYRGFSLPSVLLLITSSVSAFINPTERNEAYIDGGLFSMSVLYSLEYKKLAACALNAMFNEHTEDLIREEMNIPKEELLIMFIAIGNFKEETKSPKSQRDELSTVLRELS